MRLTGNIFIALPILTMSALLLGGDKESQALDARTAFERLKALSGEWVSAAPDTHHGYANKDAKASHVQYRVAANGSAVIETYNAGTKSEMITVFHMDGPDQLVLTHYCALGNQPMMRFEKSSNPNELKFVFAGGTNFDPQRDPHVHDGVMHLLGDDRIESAFAYYKEGKEAGTVPISLMRQK